MTCNVTIAETIKEVLSSTQSYDTFDKVQTTQDDDGGPQMKLCLPLMIMRMNVQFIKCYETVKTNNFLESQVNS